VTTPSSPSSTTKENTGATTGPAIPTLSAWREFLATADMTLVRMAISLYGKAKLVPGYIKHPPVEWIGDDQVEAYTTSEGTLVMDIHRGKVRVDEAKREIPGLEKDLHYNQSQIAKINKELREGRLGRSGELSKFEAKASEIQEEIRIKRNLIDTAVVDRIVFNAEDCY
jgi:hypothetical protein